MLGDLRSNSGEHRRENPGVAGGTEINGALKDSTNNFMTVDIVQKLVQPQIKYFFRYDYSSSRAIFWNFEHR